MPAKRMPTLRFPAGLTRALPILCAAALTSACTHAFQTSGEALPDKMHVGEFSFERPQGEGWYLKNVSDPPTIVEFTKRGHQSESQILVMGFRPEPPITNADELMEWAQTLPDESKVVTSDLGHGATCVRYHGRATVTAYYTPVDSTAAKPIAYHAMTDQDDLDCIEPHNKGLLVRFISTQRSASGGTPDGTAEAYAFLKSIQFSQK
jgi:hypothetical protein